MQAPAPTDTGTAATAAATAQPQAALPPGGYMAALVVAIGAPAAALVIALVQPHEGTVLHGYRDIAGVVTACTGHTRTAMLGRRYTPEQCRQLLASDLLAHNTDLERCIKRPLQPHEKAALLSLVFNVGHGKAGVKDGLCVLKSGRPSTISLRANAGDMPGACASISDWTGVRGRNCARPEWRSWCGGIVTRRAAERAMCEGRFAGGPADPAGGAPAAPGGGT